ncbi:DUF481 domain-containing protein [Coraliomargarita sp. W4R53]
MRNLGFYIATLLYGCCLISAPAAPSLVVLDSGEQLIGEVLPQSTADILILQSAVLGEIQLPRARVLSIAPQAAFVAPAPADKPAAKPEVAVSEPKVAAPTAVDAEKSKQAKASQIEASQIEAAAESARERETAKIEERKMLRRFMDIQTPEDWSGNMRLGINLSQGDTSWTETYANGKLEIDPKQSSNFYRLTGSYTYRQTEGADGDAYKSTDKYSAEFIYRRTFKEDWFVQNALGYRADQIKGIDMEAQETIGIGYRYKPSDKFNLLFGGGGGVEEFDADYEDTRTGLNTLVNVFQEATWSPLKRTTLVQKFNYYWNPDNTEQFNYVFTAALRVRLSDLLGLEFSYNKSFDNDVGDGSKQDDVQWRNALVIYF